MIHEAELAEKAAAQAKAKGEFGTSKEDEEKAVQVDILQMQANQ